MATIPTEFTNPAIVLLEISRLADKYREMRPGTEQASIVLHPADKGPLNFDSHRGLVRSLYVGPTSHHIPPTVSVSFPFHNDVDGWIETSEGKFNLGTNVPRESALESPQLATPELIGCSALASSDVPASPKLAKVEVLRGPACDDPECCSHGALPDTEKQESEQDQFNLPRRRDPDAWYEAFSAINIGSRSTMKDASKSRKPSKGTPDAWHDAHQAIGNQKP